MDSGSLFKYVRITNWTGRSKQHHHHHDGNIKARTNVGGFPLVLGPQLFLLCLHVLTCSVCDGCSDNAQIHSLNPSQRSKKRPRRESGNDTCYYDRAPARPLNHLPPSLSFCHCAACEGPPRCRTPHSSAQLQTPGLRFVLATWQQAAKKSK